ncbi:MAG: class I SAM-dependent methyltransferase [Candidatus Obscuribacterales bacterium]|nr:class I SAM-dependent methyltransferase [Candidatus Obscuribacterales bacterium]
MTKSNSELNEKDDHIHRQRAYFDRYSEFFCRPIPEEIQARTRHIVQCANLAADSRVLDVGTGVGCLINHFFEFGVQPTNLVGLDLSEKMLSEARSRFGNVHFCQKDIASAHPDDFPSHIRVFDVVFFNACFGNMFDQMEALRAAVKLLAGEGRVIISHPLGVEFQESLHLNEPDIVPHRLPGDRTLSEWCSQLNLSIVHSDIRNEFYLVNLKKNK